MRQIILTLLLSTLCLLLTNCSNKADCPLCQATGIIDSKQGLITCFVCNGEGELNKEDAARISSYLEIYRSDNQMSSESKVYDANVPSKASDGVTCPICNGGGRATNGYACYFCNGKGIVSRESAAQMQHIINGGSTADIFGRPGKNTSNNGGGSSDLYCVSCNGTGQCLHCKGLGVTEYNGQYGQPGGVDRCPICKGNKRCKVCNGTGRKG